MTKSELIEQIKLKQSYLCVGLDTDIEKLPAGIPKNAKGVIEFNKAIIDATAPYCVGYKINTAFYESQGIQGWEAMEASLAHIPSTHFTIADAKRGDIGNTSTYYAKTFFEKLQADAVTVAPYMGSDSVLPFTKFDGKWVVLLALTSNEGAKDFQLKAGQDGLLFENVLRTSMQWASSEKMMFVVGATRAEDIAEVRKLAPDYFFLVPGVGAQGGSLEDVVKYGANEECGLLVNSSRGIIYASDGLDFASAAKKEALKIQNQMAVHVQRWNF